MHIGKREQCYTLKNVKAFRPSNAEKMLFYAIKCFTSMPQNSEVNACNTNLNS